MPRRSVPSSSSSSSAFSGAARSVLAGRGLWTPRGYAPMKVPERAVSGAPLTCSTAWRIPRASDTDSAISAGPQLMREPACSRSTFNASRFGHSARMCVLSVNTCVACSPRARGSSWLPPSTVKVAGGATRMNSRRAVTTPSRPSRVCHSSVHAICTTGPSNVCAPARLCATLATAACRWPWRSCTRPLISPSPHNNKPNTSASPATFPNTIAFIESSRCVMTGGQFQQGG